MIVKRRLDGTVATGQLRYRRVRASVALAPDTFESIRRRASADGLSFSDEARKLLERALAQGDSSCPPSPRS